MAGSASSCAQPVLAFRGELDDGLLVEVSDFDALGNVRIGCLKAGRDGAVRQFCLKAIDIDLAQQIKESQNSEAKATSCRFWSTRDCAR